jgi:hypothetical protein
VIVTFSVFTPLVNPDIDAGEIVPVVSLKLTVSLKLLTTFSYWSLAVVVRENAVPAVCGDETVLKSKWLSDAGSTVNEFEVPVFGGPVPYETVMVTPVCACVIVTFCVFTPFVKPDVDVGLMVPVVSLMVTVLLNVVTVLL